MTLSQRKHELINDIESAVITSQYHVEQAICNLSKKQRMLSVFQEGIIDKLKGMKSSDEPEVDVDLQQKQLMCKAYDVMDYETKRPVLMVDLQKVQQPGGFNDSYVGGKPGFLPNGFRYPVSRGGRPLIFLAQINCEYLESLRGFPHHGLLQFWVSSNPAQEEDCRVYLFDDFSDPMSQEEYEKYTSLEVDRETFPIKEGVILRMRFGLREDHIWPYDNFFPEKRLLEAYNDLAEEENLPLIEDERIPSKLFTAVYDYYDGVKKYRTFGSKCGGYPYFTQADRRKLHDERSVLLFQLDSETSSEVRWGDKGIGNFFITPEELDDKNFRNVEFSWDCL
jgi:uncharacterized protein YwqG